VPERIVLADILSGLALTREQLVQIGILVGTDFNDGVYGIGAKKGLKVVRDGAFATTINEKLPEFVPEPVMGIFLKPAVTDDYTVSWGHPDVNGITRMLCDGYDFSFDRVNKALEGFEVKAGQRTLESWF
jgi:flap endonuclease-1